MAGNDQRDRKRKMLSIYIPKILQDIIWATTKNSTCVRFGFGHMCHKHKKMFDLEHVKECDLIEGVPDIEKFALKIKQEGNIRLWKEEDILAAVSQYSSLAMQLQKLTESNRISLKKLPLPKKKERQRMELAVEEEKGESNDQES